MDPEQQAAEFVTADLALVERYEGLDDATRSQALIDLGFLPQPVPVRLAASLRLMEAALHSWDVRAALDPAATVRDEAVAVLLDVVPGFLGMLAKPDAVQRRPQAVAVTLTDPDRVFGLLLGDSVELGEVPAAADATAVLPAEAWLRLLVGRLGPAHTPAGVTLTGAIGLDELRRTFPGY